MKIAFATDNNFEINQHFGLADRFAVYEITPAGYSFVENRSLPDQAKTGGHAPGESESDDKIAQIINSLGDCAIVYCTQIGGTAAARLVKKKIHPIKVESGQVIQDILDPLRDRLKTNPPLWLKKVLVNEGEAGRGKGEGQWA